MSTNLIYFLTFFTTIVFGMLYRFRMQRVAHKVANSGALIANRMLQRKKWELVLWTLLLSTPSVLLLSFRYGIGSDYFNYQRIYEEYILFGESTLEWGYLMLMRFSDWMFKSYDGLVFLCAFLSVIIIMYWTLKYAQLKHIPLALLVLLAMNMGIWFNTMRQGIAISLCAIALICVKKSKFIGFLILVVLASLMHTTALILLPCYFLLNHKNKKTPMVFVVAKLLVIAGLIFAFVYFYEQISIENDLRFSGYYDTEEGGTTPWFLIFSIFIILPELFCMPRVLQKDSKNIIYLFWIILEVIFFIIGLNVAFVFRIAEYFSVVHILLIPEIIMSSKSRATHYLLRIYYVVLFVIYFWLLYIYFGYSHIVPYEAIFAYR